MELHLPHGGPLRSLVVLQGGIVRLQASATAVVLPLRTCFRFRRRQRTNDIVKFVMKTICLYWFQPW